MNKRSKSQPVSPARVVALDLLLQWRQSSRYADDLLDSALRQKSLRAEDRALVQELFYGVLRHQLYLDFLINSFARKGIDSLPEEVQDILRLSFYQILYLARIPAYAVVDEACGLTRRTVGERMVKLVNGMLRGLLRSKENLPAVPGKENSAKHLSIRYSIPQWIVNRLLQQFGPGVMQGLARWAQSRPPLTLRVNSRRISREELLAKLKEAGIEAEAHPDVESAILLLQSGPVTELPGFEQGWWQVQDASAQVVAHILDLQPGVSVWDACAAPGGKTLHIEELLDNESLLWVSDSSLRRLGPLRDNWKRLSERPLRLWVGQAGQPPLREEYRFDRILLDVPCSGLGVLSRRVDLRYRLKEEDIPRLATLQFELLRSTAAWLRPGGLIVYSTCTLSDEENRQVVDRFLSQCPEFQRDGEDSLILPEAGRCDGAFAARLRRNG